MEKSTTAEQSDRDWIRQKEAEPPASPKRKPLLKRPLFAGILILVVAIVLIGGVLLWLHSRQYESTDDAYIDAQNQEVSPRVAGRVAKVLVDDNQEVSPGQELIDLDPRDFQNAVDQAIAAREQARAQTTQAMVQKSVFTAQAEQAQASLAVAEANADNARSQLERYQSLRQESAGAVSQEQLDNAIAANKTAAAQVEAARKAVGAAEAQIRYADSLIAAAQAGENAAEARVQQANLNLSYVKVFAEMAGRVARRQVAVGDEVQPGTPLMAIVPRDVYVTANFKETQLAKMHPGQEATIHVDAFPDLDLRGHLQSWQTGTGAAFSSLPAENATGNWVKVVQRVPVKIVIDQLPTDPVKRLGVGLSVEVKVSIK